ncbi:MAG: peptidase inhibitor family I36 protein [bacterium]
MKRGLIISAVCGLLILAGPAGGAQKGAQCPRKHVCVWADPDYQGQMVALGKRGLSNKIFAQMNDQASSLKSRIGRVAFMFTDVDGEGIRMCVLPHLKVSSLTIYGGMENSISSSKLTRRRDCP